MNVYLLIPFYKDKKNSRNKELLYCLKKNLSNKLITQVIAVCDSRIKLKHHPKIHVIINDGVRQKFSHLSELGGLFNPNGINIIANADIFFKDEDIKKLIKIDYTNNVVALSRWDIIKNSKPKHHDHKDSQDVWAFKGKLNIDGDFEMGKAGIDNRLAYEIGLNYNIVNPSNTIKSYHLHLSNIRNYEPKDSVPPPYLRVPCCYYSDKKIKKVLHVGMNYKGQSELCNALKSFGKYIFFDWQKVLKERGIIEMRNRLVSINHEFKPDIILMQLQTKDIINPETASKLNGFVLSWSGDCRQDISWMRDLAPYIDATCLSNETDTEQLRDEGFNSWFLQIGFEHKIFTPIGSKLTTKNAVHPVPDIVFMANHYKDKFPLSPERYEIAHKLKNTYGNKFLLCGNGWDIDAIDLMGKPQKEAMVYRSCKIAINANHFLHKRFSSDRIFRIMGSGAFCLTRWYPGIEKDFIDGEHLRTFSNINEMIYLINYYLKNEDERIGIAEKGCALVHDKFTWDANKRLIAQIASFPQKKEKIKEVIITTPMSNNEWREYLKKN